MATAKTTTKTAAAAPKLRSYDEMTGYLVKAQTAFKTVATEMGVPLIWDKELKFARDIIINDPSDNLRQCVPETLTAAMEQIAHVGLTLNPLKHHGTIIARWNRKMSLFEAHFLPMYRGLVYLGTQAGVHDVDSEVVYKSDTFTIGRNEHGGYVRHEINPSVPRGADSNFFVGAYVMARMPKSGERKVEWVPAEDIFAMRDQSDGYKDDKGNIRPKSPWVVWFDEQAKKSALKRASKRWEEAIDDSVRWQRFQKAVDLDHQAEGGHTIEGTATVVDEVKLTVEQTAEIESKAKELGQGDVNKYLRRVCAAYGAEVLADVPAKFHNEILERIKASKAEIDKRRADEKKK